jgi:predicted small secreted protein
MRFGRIMSCLLAGVLALAVLLLTSCNTFEGLGKDVEKGGEAIQDVAK